MKMVLGNQSLNKKRSNFHFYFTTPIRPVTPQARSIEDLNPFIKLL